MPEPTSVAVLYDRDCGFCRWSVAWLLRVDRRRSLEPVAIQSARGQALLATVPDGLRLESAHAVSADGTVRSGGDAAAVIAERLPFGSLPATAFRAAPAATRRAYLLVAGNRTTVGRLVPRSSRARADALLSARSDEGGFGSARAPQ